MSGPARAVRLEVAASSANLGAGFDALALALDVVNVIEVTEAADVAPGTVVVTVQGEGEGELPTDGSDRFSRAFLGAIRGATRGWRVSMANGIPISRGLGSSAAATIAGLVAARESSDHGPRLDDAQVLAEASAVEGHPENAAAALHGGFVVTAMIQGRPVSVRMEPPQELRVCLFVPDRPLTTTEMRRVLPETVPRADAVHNVGRATLAVAAFAQGRLDLLAAATDDRLHEPYRAAIYPELPALLAAGRRAGALGACLSGAGSTVMAFADSPALGRVLVDAFESTASELGLAGRSMVVAPRSAGVRIVSAGG